MDQTVLPRAAEQKRWVENKGIMCIEKKLKLQTRRKNKTAKISKISSSTTYSEKW